MLQDFQVPMGLIAIAITILVTLILLRRRGVQQLLTLSEPDARDRLIGPVESADSQEATASKLIDRDQILQGRAALEIAQLDSLADQLVSICERVSACLDPAREPSEKRQIYALIAELTLVSGVVAEAHSAAIAHMQPAHCETTKAEFTPYRLSQAA